MGYQPTLSTPSFKPTIPAQRRGLIVCDYCGMSYDGNEHDNCPHCYAPRGEPEDIAESEYVEDDEAYYAERMFPNGLMTLNDSRETFYADNTLYYIANNMYLEDICSDMCDAPQTYELSDDELIEYWDNAPSGLAERVRPTQLSASGIPMSYEVQMPTVIPEPYGTVERDGDDPFEAMLCVTVVLLFVVFPLAFMAYLSTSS